MISLPSQPSAAIESAPTSTEAKLGSEESVDRNVGLAEQVGITERAAQRIVAELVADRLTRDPVRHLRMPGTLLYPKSPGEVNVATMRHKTPASALPRACLDIL